MGWGGGVIWGDKTINVKTDKKNPQKTTNLQDVKPSNNPEFFCPTAIEFDFSVYIHLYNEVKSSALSFSITNYDITAQGADTSSLYVCWAKPSFISVM